MLCSKAKAKRREKSVNNFRHGPPQCASIFPILITSLSHVRAKERTLKSSFQYSLCHILSLDVNKTLCKPSWHRRLEFLLVHKECGDTVETLLGLGRGDASPLQLLHISLRLELRLAVKIPSWDGFMQIACFVSRDRD